MPPWLRRSLLGVALFAALGSPAPTPETTQGPIWEGEGYLSAVGPEAVTDAAPLEASFQVRLTIPASSSGTTTSKATLIVSLNNTPSATVRGALSDGAGTELVSGEIDAAGPDSSSGYLRVSARDVLASCEVGVVCEVPLSMAITVDGDPAQVYWELVVEARDGEVGADAKWVEIELSRVDG